MRVDLAQAYGAPDLEIIAELLGGAGICGFGAEGNRSIGYQISVPAPDLDRATEVIRSSEAFRCGRLLIRFPADQSCIEAEAQGFDGFLKWRHECYQKRHPGPR